MQDTQKIKDRPELAYQDFIRWGEDANADWVHYYVQNSRKEIYDWLTEMGVVFFVVAAHEGNSVPKNQALLLFKQGASLDRGINTTGPTHLAFAIDASELEGWEKWLTEKGIPIERKNRWQLGGQSLYFRDPDGHSIELATPGTWTVY